MRTQQNNEIVAELLGSIATLRKEKREEAITNGATAVYSFLKENGFRYFNKELLLSFMPCELGKTAQYEIIGAIVKLLLSNKKIEKSSRYKTYRRFKLCELETEDYQSYAVMMKANGYRTRFYKWKQNGGIPTRQFIGSGSINGNNEDLISECDEAEQVTSKPYKKLGVYDRGNLSIRKAQELRRVVCYAVL